MKNNRMQPNFYFHDYESFGVNPVCDRPVQFAGIRTDMNFNIIEDPLVIYCKPVPDCLPDPNSVLITGITPQEAYKKGICEAEFAKCIHRVFSKPNSCILGYNNIRFDDEITRHLFYRNFYNSYDYSWKNGNSRWDLLDVVRACYALRPESIFWPSNEETGLPSFRLEHLTAANNIAHDHAHDAMSDVYATVAIAKLIKKKQPKLFDYLFHLRNKRHVSELIDVPNMTPLVHVSGMLGAYRGNTTWVAPLAQHPEQNNAVIVCDLMGDIQPLIDCGVEELKIRLYTKKEELLENMSPIPLKLIHTNKCPIIAPAKTLNETNAKRLNIDRDKCLTNLQLLRKCQHVIQHKVTALFSSSNNYEYSKDVDDQLYAGFFNNHDNKLCETVRNTPAELLKNLNPPFHDDRLKILYFRYKARNYPYLLTKAEQKCWDSYHCDKFNEHNIRDYLYKLEQLVEKYQYIPEKLILLKAIYDYCQFITHSLSDNRII